MSDLHHLDTDPTAATPGRLWLSAAVLTTLAGICNAFSALGMTDSWFDGGAFALFIAMAQLMYGVALLLMSDQFTRSWLMVGIAGNGLLVGLYSLTRTIELPWLPPDLATPWPIEFSDLVTVIAETGALVCLILLFRRSRTAHSATLVPHEARSER
jgi:hypothetical protein